MISSKHKTILNNFIECDQSTKQILFAINFISLLSKKHGPRNDVISTK